MGRTYDADTCKNQRKALGGYSELKGHEIFAAARKDADAWSNQVENGSVRAGKIETVADTRCAYLKEKPGPIAAGVFRRQIFPDPIAKVKIDSYGVVMYKDWRKRLEETPALMSPVRGQVLR